MIELRRVTQEAIDGAMDSVGDIRTVYKSAEIIPTSSYIFPFTSSEGRFEVVITGDKLLEVVEIINSKR